MTVVGVFGIHAPTPALEDEFCRRSGTWGGVAKCAYVKAASWEDYADHGRHLLTLTGARTVLCLGGGACAAAEIARARAGETWHVFGVGRTKNGAMEECHITAATETRATLFFTPCL
jgi:hypothetical protein